MAARGRHILTWRSAHGTKRVPFAKCPVRAPGVFQPRSHEFAARLVSAIWRTEEMPNRVIYRTIWGKCRNSSIEFVRFAHTPAGIEGDWMLKESWIGWAVQPVLRAWPTNPW